MNHLIKTWIITYNFGSIKAGPVIRFLRYYPFFKEKGIDIVFLTKKRKETFEHNENCQVNTKFFSVNNTVQLTNMSITHAIREKVKPNNLLFFSLSYKSLPYLFLAKLYGIRLLYVSTMHLDLQFKESGKKRNYFNRLLLFLTLQVLYNTVDFIICSTNHLKKDFINLKIPENKIKVIYNGVNTSRFKPLNNLEKISLRHKLDIPKNKLVFLYVGLFIERKGVDYLLYLWDRFTTEQSLKDSTLLMVGKDFLDTDENSQNFKRKWPFQKEKAILSGNVIFRPFCDNVESYFQTSDVFIFTSKLEGMPNVLLEAMSSGLAILVNKFAGFSEDYGRPGEEFLFLTLDIKKDLKTLLSIKEKAERRENLSINARNYALNNFTLQNSIDKYIRLFV